MKRKIKTEGEIATGNCITQVESNKSHLKSTPEVRNAIDSLGDETNFIVSSSLILKYVDDLLGSSEDLENVDVEYVIKRLVSGLASKRKYFRHGFYVTLQNLLQIHPEILPLTFSTINKFNSQEQSKNAVTDHVIGHILALGAIIRSGCVMHNSSFAKVILEKLLILRPRCSYTDPIVGQFIVHMLKNDGNEAVSLVWEVAKNELLVPLRALSPCLLWIRIILCREEFLKHLPGVTPGFPKETFNQLSFSIVYTLMKKMFADHISVSEILSDYLLSLSLYKGDLEGNENLVSFFDKCVVPSLEDSSTVKIGFNFKIIELLLPHLVKVEHIKSILCPTLVQQLVQYLSKGSKKGEVCISSIKKIVAAILLKIIAHKEKDDDVQITILKQLIITPGTVRFDSVTGTNLLHQSYEYLSVSTIKELCTELLNIIKNDKYEISTGLSGLCLFSGDVLASAKLISQLTSHPSVVGSNHAKWRSTQIAGLLKNIFFRKHPPKELKTLKEYFLKALEHPTKKLEDQTLVIENVIEITDEYMKKHKKKCSLSLELQECWKKVLNTMKEIKEISTDNPHKYLSIFKLFYGQMNLHLFIDAKMAQEVIMELDQCYKKAIRSLKKKKKSHKDEGPEWVEVIVDLLLSLLSKGDHYWRKFVVSVFRNICHLMDSASMSLISDVINPHKEANFLMSSKDDAEDEDDEKVEDDEDEDEEDEVDSAEEEDEGDSTDEEDEGDSSDEFDSSEEEDCEDEEQLNEKDKRELKSLKLREEMQKLVGLPGEDVDMDTVPLEELEALDKNVGAIMKAYLSLKKSTKKKKKTKLAKDETSLMHFRTRVCDLLEGLVFEAPTFGHLLNLVHPLLLAIDKASKDSLQQQLYARLKSVYLHLVKVKKFVVQEAITPEDIANEIGPLFDLSRKLSSNMSKEIGLGCVFLVRCGLNLFEEEDPTKGEIIINAYTQQLELFFSKKDWDVTEMAFTGTLNLETGLLAPVLKMVTKIAFDKSTRSFRKQQALDMLKILFSNERSLKKMSPKTLRSSQKKMSSLVIQTFEDIKESKKIQILQLVAILDLLKVLKIFHKHNPKLEKSWNWDEVNQAIESFYRRVPVDHMKTLKKAFCSLAEVLHIKLEKAPLASALKKEIVVKKEKEDIEVKKEQQNIVVKKEKEDIEVKKEQQNIVGKKDKDVSVKKEKIEPVCVVEKKLGILGAVEEGEDLLMPFVDEDEVKPKSEKQLKKEKKKELKELKKRTIEEVENDEDADAKLKKRKHKKLSKKLKKINNIKERNKSRLAVPVLENVKISELANM